MDLVQLRAFVAIVQSQGVGRAAERLNTSQSALSRQLQNLEEELQLPLFNRERRQMLLTDNGKDLLARAIALLADAEAIKERAHALRDAKVGVIRFGATPPMIENLLAPFLVGWHKRHQHIAVELIEDGGAALADRLDRGDVHMAYIPAGDRRFEYRLLFPVHVVAAVAAQNSLARARVTEVKNVVRLPLLLLHGGFGSRQWFDAACYAAGVTPSVVLESASPSAIMALAAADYGVGILPSAMPAPANVSLIPITHLNVPLGRWTMLAWSRRRYTPPYVETFLKEFRIFALKHYPGRNLMKRVPIRPPAQFG
jgi:DNA-binding transcriptional LysR family regulator